MIKPSSNFYQPFQGRASFVDPVCYLCFMSVMLYALSVPCHLVTARWEKADLLALLFAMFSCVLSLFHMVSWVGCGI